MAGPRHGGLRVSFFGAEHSFVHLVGAPGAPVSGYSHESYESEQVASASSSRIGQVRQRAVSVAGGALVVSSGVQGGHVPASEQETLVIALVIAAMVVACVLISMYLRRQRRRPTVVNDQWQAQAVMGELCPHGWQAQITLFGWDAPIPADAPASRVPLVELEWKQFDEEPGRVAVARRIWAPTIGEALQKMVEDRQTDLRLEEIEHTVADEDDL